MLKPVCDDNMKGLGSPEDVQEKPHEALQVLLKSSVSGARCSMVRSGTMRRSCEYYIYILLLHVMASRFFSVDVCMESAVRRCPGREHRYRRT